VITHLFFDVGGVLGSSGWGTEPRARAVERFHLDGPDFDRRHREVVGAWEEGRLTLDEYLDATVFDVPRAFAREDFAAFMRAQSAPYPETIALARALAATGRYHLMTINNESAELNAYRLRHFGLAGLFTAFFSSCWLGVAKPSRRIYELALAMAQAEAGAAVLIDDREQNLPPARALGMHAIRFTTADGLRRDLAAFGVATEGATMPRTATRRPETA
jgi:putative hydrolase of the HAD superfamily